MRCFNPRPRAGSDATGMMRPFVWQYEFQSTPPRGKRHDRRAWRYHRHHPGVSIHAPAREATRCHRRHARQECLALFQSTPPRGKRPAYASAAVNAVDEFQSTPPRGKRRRCGCPGDLAFPVSIHAPAREATSRPCTRGSPTCRFNPRPRAGSDAATRSAGARSTFQSTPPRGKRRCGRAGRVLLALETGKVSDPPSAFIATPGRHSKRPPSRH